MASTEIYGPEARRVDAAARAIPIGSTPSSWRKTFPNGGLPRLGLAAPWPGRGSAPGSGAHLGSPRVLHDLVVIIRHVAHRRVRRVRRVRGGVWPHRFRGKFLTDCEYLSNSDQVTGRNPTLRKGIKGRTKRCCAALVLHFYLTVCSYEIGRVYSFTKKISSSIPTRSSRFPLGTIWHLTTKSAF